MLKLKSCMVRRWVRQPRWAAAAMGADPETQAQLDALGRGAAEVRDPDA